MTNSSYTSPEIDPVTLPTSSAVPELTAPSRVPLQIARPRIRLIYSNVCTT